MQSDQGLISGRPAAPSGHSWIPGDSRKVEGFLEILGELRGRAGTPHRPVVPQSCFHCVFFFVSSFI